MTEGEGGGEKNGKVRNAKGKGGDGGGGDKSPHKMEVGAHCLERRRGADGDNVGCRTRLSVPTEDKCDVRVSLWGSAAAIALSCKGPTLWNLTLGVCRGRAPPRDCAPSSSSSSYRVSRFFLEQPEGAITLTGTQFVCGEPG